jgi:hypothetical protein
MEDLLEPEFVSLVDDDEEHLIMGMELSLDKAQRRLKSEELVDREITTVVGRLAVGLERAVHAEVSRAE